MVEIIFCVKIGAKFYLHLKQKPFNLVFSYNVRYTQSRKFKKAVWQISRG